jgi:hypothetical protein
MSFHEKTNAWHLGVIDVANNPPPAQSSFLSAGFRAGLHKTLSVLTCMALFLSSCSTRVAQQPQVTVLSQGEVKQLVAQLEAQMPVLPASRISAAAEIKWELAMGGESSDGTKSIAVPTGQPDQAVLAAFEHGQLTQFKLITSKKLADDRLLVVQTDLESKTISYGAIDPQVEGKIYGITTESFGAISAQSTPSKQSTEEVWQWIVDRSFTARAAALELIQPQSNNCPSLLAALNNARLAYDGAVQTRDALQSSLDLSRWAAFGAASAAAVGIAAAAAACGLTAPIFCVTATATAATLVGIAFAAAAAVPAAERALAGAQTSLVAAGRSYTAAMAAFNNAYCF